MSLFRFPPKTPNADYTLDLLVRRSDEDPRLPRTPRLLPEWARQEAVQLTWPHAATDWAPRLQEVEAVYVRLAYEIATRETLLVVHPRPEEVRKRLEEQLPQRAVKNIRYAAVPTDDTWARDHAALTLDGAEGLRLLDFRFRGWGGKFEASHDNAINRRLAEQQVFRVPLDDAQDVELEGGSIEIDDDGVILTTETCLLNPNRRGLEPRGRERVESMLHERLGATRVVWLRNGYLAGDDTDAHIDTLARLCPNHTILYITCDDPEDEHYEALRAMQEELRATDFRLIPLPMAPKLYDEEGARLPATYANYLVLNDAVLLPTYGDAETDERAARAVAEAFPGRDVVGVDCKILTWQHGSLHCATMQYPKGVLAQNILHEN